MGRNDRRKATDAELDVLNVLWRRGGSTVREVHDALAGQREVGYTTTLKTLQVMARKGLATRDESARAHVYAAAIEREAMQKKLVGDLVDRVFNGSALGLVAGALSAKKASPAELAHIRRLLDHAEEDAS